MFCGGRRRCPVKATRCARTGGDANRRPLIKKNPVTDPKFKPPTHNNNQKLPNCTTATTTQSSSVCATHIRHSPQLPGERRREAKTLQPLCEKCFPCAFVSHGGLDTDTRCAVSHIMYARMPYSVSDEEGLSKEKRPEGNMGHHRRTSKSFEEKKHTGETHGCFVTQKSSRRRKYCLHRMATTTHPPRFSRSLNAPILSRRRRREKKKGNTRSAQHLFSP